MCDWGIDYLKIDFCHGNHHTHSNTSWALFREGFDSCFKRTGRYTTMSCESCMDPNQCGRWIGETCNSWRTGGDVQAYFDSIMSNIHRNNEMAQVVNQGQAQRNARGNFNDPDMLEIGNAGLSYEEQKTMFSLWSISGAPLLIGTSLIDMSNETFQILSNEKIIEIDQDLGLNGKIQGVMVDQGTDWEVWVKMLANENDVAVAMVNTGMNTIDVTANFTKWGWKDSTIAKAENLWISDGSMSTVTGCVFA